ncbi:MAG: amidohydrolase family protein [Chitinophagaceae bacterium]|nr:amidohydrolase family protein [Chitinophagaceae bacterium]
MKYRKIAADQIFTGHGMAPDGAVLVLSDDGTVIDLVSATDAGDDTEKYPGLLSPGFVNAHCHLELSHLKGLVPPGTGLVDFLLQVVQKRSALSVDVQEAIRDAEADMEAAGIVAVGDICNTTDTVEIKGRSRIAWTNFVEVLSFRDETAAERIAHYQSVREQFLPLPDTGYHGMAIPRASLVPHAPYSISPRSFQLINEASSGQVVSMHNQETPAEDELYRSGQGDFLRLFSYFGNTAAPNPVTGQSSLRSVLPYFNGRQTLLLVHNTCTVESDLQFAREFGAKHSLETYFCLCPNANLYIENRLPPVEMLLAEHANIVLGTDSLSSNYQLSIAAEIHTLRSAFPGIPLETMLGWATLSGARALKRDDLLGSFDKGKKPGVVLLDEKLRPKKII